MRTFTALLLITVLSFMLSGWAKADDTNTHTQLLQRILSALEREVDQLEDQHVNRELELDDTLDDQLGRLAEILARGSDVKETNSNVLNKKRDPITSEEHNGKQDSEMTNEKKDMVKKLLVSLVKKTKHCGPLGEGDICADSHDCCCGYTCWKWRCQDKPKANIPNWWDILHQIP